MLGTRTARSKRPLRSSVRRPLKACGKQELRGTPPTAHRRGGRAAFPNALTKPRRDLPKPSPRSAESRPFSPVWRPASAKPCRASVQSYRGSAEFYSLSAGRYPESAERYPTSTKPCIASDTAYFEHVTAVDRFQHSPLNPVPEVEPPMNTDEHRCGLARVGTRFSVQMSGRTPSTSALTMFSHPEDFCLPAEVLREGEDSSLSRSPCHCGRATRQARRTVLLWLRAEPDRGHL